MRGSVRGSKEKRGSILKIAAGRNVCAKTWGGAKGRAHPDKKGHKNNFRKKKT